VPCDQDGRAMLPADREVPDWFRDALARGPRERRIPVKGTDIEVLEWGDGPGPGVLLMHGHGAHADWWRPIAPYLVEAAGRVVAFSCSGMGGSGWRAAYDMETFGEEVSAIGLSTGLIGAGRKPFLIAHSFGCLPTMIAAQRHAEAIAGVALIDMYLPVPGRVAARPQPRKARRYETLEQALGRFRLSPEQDCPNPFLVDYVAHRTLRHVGGSDPHWTWCTDPAATIQVVHDEHRARLASLEVPLTILRGECSRLVDRDVAAFARTIAPPGTRFVDIPEADHHVLLDQPLALAAALRTLIAFGGDK